MPMKNPRIYVMERGWILVGYPSPGEDFLFLNLDRCHTIRRWGTTRGLGQLAAEGPQPETILDSEGDGVEIRRTAIYRSIRCNPEAWAGV